jgi:hypothetical protein
MIDLMAMGTHHALILFFDQYLTLSGLVYGGVFERHPICACSCSSAAAAGSRTGWTGSTSSSTPTRGRCRRRSPRSRARSSGATASISFDPGERTMGAMAELAGEDNLIWASDFPHSDAKYPGVVDELMESVAAMAERARAQAGRRERGARVRDRGAVREARALHPS